MESRQLYNYRMPEPPYKEHVEWYEHAANYPAREKRAFMSRESSGG